MEDTNGNNGNGNGNGNGDTDAGPAETPAAPAPTQAAPPVPIQPAPPAAQPPAPYPPQGYPPQPQMPPPGYQAPPPGYYPPPPPGYYPPPPRLKKRPSNKPNVVGSLLVVVAVLGLVMAALSFTGMAFFSEVSDWFPGEEGDTMTLEGRVTSLNGTGLTGAVVNVVDEGLAATTDGEGYYVIYNVPIGDQTIRCSKDGYTTINRRVTVMADIFNGDGPGGPGEPFTQDVDFALSEGTGEVTTGTWIDADFFDFRALWLTCSVILIITSLLALLGAFYAFKRTNMMWVLIGCVAGIFTIGFMIGTVLAFIALFILLLSLDEFKNGKKKDEE
ncbi:MAG: carboxypeptidase regulatory-like domain-containing protein [Thermoplasmata archaeon]|nr:carboxypeptidase regulatory-like domain-containing protein [Thermoplasmata archaeon]